MKEQRIAYLIDRIVDANDQTAFSELYHLYFHQLLGYASTFTNDSYVSQEHVEDVFVRLWLNRSMLRSVNNLRYYLFTSVKNASLNYLSRSKNSRYAIAVEGEESHLGTDHTPEHIFVEKELFKTLDYAIESLPPKCRMVFRLVREERMSHKQIASLLGISFKTIENHMSTAIKKLMKAVDAHLNVTQTVGLEKKI